MSCCQNLEELNKKLATRSYIEGYSFSNKDKEALEGLTGFPCKNSFPHAFRWAKHIAALLGVGNFKFACTGAAAPSSSKPAAAPAKAAAADDDMDLFDDEEELDEEAQAAADKARHERMALALKLKQEKDAGKEKKEKEKPVEKSLIVLEVKPWEADCDLEMVWRKIIQKEQQGLTWGQTFKLEPVAFGIKKLVMTVTIVDALVLLDDITEYIEAMEEWVQSVNIASMNKIS